MSREHPNGSDDMYLKFYADSDIFNWNWRFLQKLPDDTKIQDENDE
jgi:hypothetical protein